jgi:hypothetical protein
VTRFENLAIFLPRNASLYNIHKGGQFCTFGRQHKQNPKPKFFSRNQDKPQPFLSLKQKHKPAGPLTSPLSQPTEKPKKSRSVETKADPKRRREK